MEKKLVLVPGFQKCGTTSLFYYLMENFQSFASGPKEPNFFSLRPEDLRDNLHWYLSLFSGDSDTILDASTSYAYFPEIVEELLPQFSDVKAIFITRPPLERIASAYSHSFKRSSYLDGREISTLESLFNNSKCLEELLENETAQVYKAICGQPRSWRGNRYHRDRFNLRTDVQFIDPNWHLYYCRNSIYQHYLTEWKARLGGSNVLTLSLTQFLSDCDDVRNKIAEFLGTSCKSSKVEFPWKNASVQRSGIGRFAFTLLERHYYKLLGSTATELPPIFGKKQHVELKLQNEEFWEAEFNKKDVKVDQIRRTQHKY